MRGLLALVGAAAIAGVGILAWNGPAVGGLPGRRCDRQVPVIAVSGYSGLQERALREAAFARVLKTPIDPWVLSREVAAVVRPREVGSESDTRVGASMPRSKSGAPRPARS